MTKLPRKFEILPPRSPQPIGGLLELHATRTPDRAALSCGSVTLSHVELAARVNRRAHALRRAGVDQDDFVAIALPNGIDFLEIAFACWTLGATPAPVSQRLPQMELRGILDLLQPKLLVGDAMAAITDLPVIAPEDLIEVDATAKPIAAAVATHVKAIASGGSTGRPKVIVDRAKSLLDPDTPSFGMRAGDTVLIPGPLYHAAPFGLAYMALSWGCHVVIVPRFDPAETLRLIERHRVTWLYQVPTMMHRIWRLGAQARAEADVSSLEVVYHIAAPCPVWLKESWIGWLGPDTIWEVYGGTEAIAGTVIGGREWLTHKGSVGKPVGGSLVRIFEESGREAATGQVGEVYFLPPGGKGSTYRYIGAEPRAREEWETFGDLGYLDDDGFLYLADRRTDLIISGGSNIYPAEVEAAIEAHPAVMASIVVGLPDDDLGQRVHAIVEIRDGSTPPTPDDLRQFMSSRVATYKIPRSFELTTDRLRDDAGKARRGALLAARLAAGT